MAFVKVLQIDESTEGKRLDQLGSELAVFSRSKLQQQISAGLVRVNGNTQQRSYTLQVGDQVTLSEAQDSKTPIDFEVLFEDDAVIAINKPRGVLMHARGNDDSEFTVADFIASRTTDVNEGRAGIVHRLDRETSGVVLLAKTQEARELLQSQFSDRLVKKQYRALAFGVIDDEKARFEWPIERHPKKPYSFRVGQTGKSARTILKLVKVGHVASEVLLEPRTGRTHQLRVHMAHYGHPIVGDSLYSDKKRLTPKLYLHAERITFNDLSSKSQTISCKPDWSSDEVNGVLNG